MRILHVTNQITLGGGVAKAVIDLVNAQANEIDMDIFLLTSAARETLEVGSLKDLLEPKVSILSCPMKLKMSLYIARLIEWCWKRVKGDQVCWSSSGLVGSSLANYICRLDFDVIHLHWVQDGMFAWKDIQSLNTNIVWTLHDYWPCNSPSHGLDMTYKQSSWYEILYKRATVDLKVAFIAPSRIVKLNFMASAIRRGMWEKECRNDMIWVIPNIYERELSSNGSRLAESLYLDRKVCVGFGAKDYMQDSNKGFRHFVRLIDELASLRDVDVVLFGSQEAGIQHFKSSLCITSYGMIRSREQLASVLQTIDIFCVLSDSETFGYTTVEAIDCGCIAAVRDTCGLSDLVSRSGVGISLEDLEYRKWAMKIDSVCSQGIEKECDAEFWNSLCKEQIVRKHKEVYQRCIDKR